MKEPVLSICICSLAGADRISDTLWSLVCQSADPSQYEVLVIENDPEAAADMHRVAEGVQRPETRVRVVVEPQLGLSHARNRAIAESRGDYILFIDDDATASPRLVEHYLDAIANHAPDVIGGNVHPHFDSMPPPELEYSWWPCWSLKHFGPHDRWLDDGEYFLGTNVGASRAVFEARSFDTQLGRKGDSLVGGEEWYLGRSEFMRRFVSGASVYHLVTRARMEPGYLVKRMYYGTLSKKLSEGDSTPAGQFSVLDRLLIHARRVMGQLVLLARRLDWFLRIATERRRFLRAQAARDAAARKASDGANTGARA